MYVCDMADSVRKLGSVQDSHRMIRSQTALPSHFFLLGRTNRMATSAEMVGLGGGRSAIIYECLINTEPLKYFTPPPSNPSRVPSLGG